VGRLGGINTGEGERVRAGAGTNASDEEVWYAHRDSSPWESLSCLESCHIHATIVFGEPGWYPTDQPHRSRRPSYAPALPIIHLQIPWSSASLRHLCKSISTGHTNVYLVRCLMAGPRSLYFVPPLHFAFLKFCVWLLLRPPMWRQPKMNRLVLQHTQHCSCACKWYRCWCGCMGRCCIRN